MTPLSKRAFWTSALAYNAGLISKGPHMEIRDCTDKAHSSEVAKSKLAPGSGQSRNKQTFLFAANQLTVWVSRLEPRMEHGFNAGSVPCSVCVSSVAADFALTNEANVWVYLGRFQARWALKIIMKKRSWEA